MAKKYTIFVFEIIWKFDLLILGFILQVRDNENKIVGHFIEGKNYKFMTCDNRYGNSITHINSRHKNKISSKWQNHTDTLTENLIIHAVVVFNYKHAQILKNEINLQPLISLF